MEFQDLIDEITDGSLESEAEKTQDNPEGPVVEESPDPEKPAEDPVDDEAEGEPAKKADDAEDDGAEASEESESEPTDDDESGREEDAEDPMVLLPDGSKVPYSTIQEWRNSGLRRDDYSRKTAEAAQTRKQAEALVQDVRTLSGEIARDPHMQRFLSAHPEAIEYLMAEPEATRALLGNKEGVEKFWGQYEVLLDNPELAEQLERRNEVPAEVDFQTQFRSAVAVGHGLNYVIEQIGAEFEGVPQDQVARHLLELGGMRELPEGVDQETAQTEFVLAMARLHNMLFSYDAEGNPSVNTRLIRDRYEYLSGRQRDKTDTERKKAEEHNRKVDEQLKAGDGRPPATPSGGSPGTNPERLPDYGSLSDVLSDIMAGDL